MDRKLHVGSLILILTFKIYVFSCSRKTDEWSNGQTDEWTNRQTDERRNGQTNGLTDREINPVWAG
jgi:hypothetical protein